MMQIEAGAIVGPEGPPDPSHDVLEFPLLLTTWQVEALTRASSHQGMTAGQLARVAIADFLARSMLKQHESRQNGWAM